MEGVDRLVMSAQRVVCSGKVHKHSPMHGRVLPEIVQSQLSRCLNLLQSAQMAFGEVTEEAVYKCAGAPPPQDVEMLLRSLLEDDYATAFKTAWELMQAKGLALQDIVTELHNHVLLLDVKSGLAKAMLVASLADVEHRLSVGTNEKVQLAGLVGIFSIQRSAFAS